MNKSAKNKMPEISKRARDSQFSPIRKFVPILERTKGNGVEVLELHIGQPDMPTPKGVLAGIKSFNNKTIAYTASDGIPELKSAWISYYKDVGVNLDVSDIVVTTGGSEAILFALLSTCDPGDEIIVFEPFYTNYNGYASMAGVKLVPILTLATNGFHLPGRTEVEKKISKKTKGILICNPNNPTGTVYNRKELGMLASIAEKHNLFILSDEAYREFVYDSAEHISIMNLRKINKDRMILLDSVSKKFNVCGSRIGCLASKNPKIIESVTKFAQARLSSPQIEQLAMIPLLRDSLQYTRSIVSEYAKRRKVFMREIKSIPSAFCIKPMGAFYSMVKLPIKDSDNFTEWLLTSFSYKNQTVSVAPGSGFYATKGQGKNEIRIALVLSPRKLKQAISLLKIGLERYEGVFGRKRC